MRIEADRNFQAPSSLMTNEREKEREREGETFDWLVKQDVWLH